MMVDDLIWKLYNQEMYEYVINSITYDQPSDIPNDLLNKQVQHWEVKQSAAFGNLLRLVVTTWNAEHEEVVDAVLDKGFSLDQVRNMLKNGASLSTITDMALSIDGVIDAYTKLGYNKHQIRYVVYEAYAEIMIQEMYADIMDEDKFIGG